MMYGTFRETLKRWYMDCFVPLLFWGLVAGEVMTFIF